MNHIAVKCAGNLHEAIAGSKPGLKGSDYASPTSCVTLGTPTTLVGRLRQIPFSNIQYDREIETLPVLELDHSICAKGQYAEPSERIWFVTLWNGAEGNFPSVGSEVEIRGIPEMPSSPHHHERLIMEAKSISLLGG
jgi:hypothetical protein